MAQQVRIEVRLPEGHWAGDVSRQNPSGILRIEEHMPLSKGRGMARCWSDFDMSSAIEEHAGVDAKKSLSDQHFSVEIVAGGGGFLKPLRKAGVVPRTPFEIRDGWVEWFIEASKDNLKEMFRLFDESSIPYRLLSTRQNSNSRCLNLHSRRDITMYHEKHLFRNWPNNWVLLSRHYQVNFNELNQESCTHLRMIFEIKAPNMFVRTCS
jgi:hypothetical protein